MRSLAGGVYASFLIPGAMAIGAQIGGDNKLVWRSTFVILTLAGMFFTTRLLARISKMSNPGFFARSRWLVILLYLVVLIKFTPCPSQPPVAGISPTPGCNRTPSGKMVPGHQQSSRSCGYPEENRAACHNGQPRLC